MRVRPQGLDVVADRGEHPPHLVVAALDRGDRGQRGDSSSSVAGASGLLSRLRASACRRRRSRPRPAQCEASVASYTLAGATFGEVIRCSKRAIVGHQQQAGSVAVQAAHARQHRVAQAGSAAAAGRTPAGPTSFVEQV
jgi:hypothetical protein